MDTVDVDHVEETSITAVCAHCDQTMLTMTTTTTTTVAGQVKQNFGAVGTAVIGDDGTMWPYCHDCVTSGRTTLPEEGSCRS
jgi:primosomal protein N'